MNKKILITGGSGFIGSHVVDYFVDNGHEVIVVDNEISINSGYKNKNAIYLKFDINSEKLEELFENYNFEVCVHLAAQASVSVSIKNPIYDATVNILGTIHLLELCKKYNCKFIAASSAAVYGNPKYLPIDEMHNTAPLSQYGLSKLTMEKYIKISGIPYVICRFSNVYGERQNSSGEAGVVSIFNDAMIKNENIYIDGDGEQSRDFIYVKDVAKIIYKLFKNKVENKILNISTNKAYTINDLFEIMAKIHNYKKSPIYRDSRIGDIKNSILDNSQLRQLIDGEVFMSLEGGLQKLGNYNIINA